MRIRITKSDLDWWCDRTVSDGMYRSLFRKCSNQPRLEFNYTPPFILLDGARWNIPPLMTEWMHGRDEIFIPLDVTLMPE